MEHSNSPDRRFDPPFCYLQQGGLRMNFAGPYGDTAQCTAFRRCVCKLPASTFVPTDSDHYSSITPTALPTRPPLTPAPTFDRCPAAYQFNAGIGPIANCLQSSTGSPTGAPCRDAVETVQDCANFCTGSVLCTGFQWSANDKMCQEISPLYAKGATLASANRFSDYMYCVKDNAPPMECADSKDSSWCASRASSCSSVLDVRNACCKTCNSCPPYIYKHTGTCESEVGYSVIGSGAECLKAAKYLIPGLTDLVRAGSDMKSYMHSRNRNLGPSLGCGAMEVSSLQRILVGHLWPQAGKAGTTCNNYRFCICQRVGTPLRAHACMSLHACVLQGQPQSTNQSEKVKHVLWYILLTVSLHRRNATPLQAAKA